MKIKEEFVPEYKDYVEKNSDPYSSAVVKAGEKVGEMLDEGETAEKALDGLLGEGLSGAMAGAAVFGVVRYNPRGEELKVAWNKSWGGTGEEVGTIDPSIIEIG